MVVSDVRVHRCKLLYKCLNFKAISGKLSAIKWCFILRNRSTYLMCTKRKSYADSKMIKMFPAYLKNYGKNIQVGNESPSTYTWAKLFHWFVMACHHHHGQVKEKLVLSSFLPLLLFWFNLIIAWSFVCKCLLIFCCIPAVCTGYM